MADTFHSCPNCHVTSEGRKILQCRNCGKVFCEKCALYDDKILWTNKLCPSCKKDMVSTLGTIKK